MRVTVLLSTLRDATSLAGKHQAFSIKGKRAAALNVAGDAASAKARAAAAAGHHSRKEGSLIRTMKRGVNGAALCTEYCTSYNQGEGVDATTMMVTIDASGYCSLPTASDAGCVQIFHDECADHCSQWTDVTPTTLNVCQHSTDTYKCEAIVSGSCPSTHTKCKQKPVQDCSMLCEGFEFDAAQNETVDQDTRIVCQNRVSTNAQGFGTCMALPCAQTGTRSSNYPGVACLQTYSVCAADCPAGTDIWTNTSTICYNTETGACRNQHRCEEDFMRCTRRDTAAR